MPLPLKIRKSMNTGDSVIAQFNERHDLRTILERFGYRRVGNRMIRPGAEEKSMPGVRFFTRQGTNTEVCFAWSTNDKLHGKHAHDAFSVVCTLKYNGEINKAVRDIADAMGIKKPDDDPIKSALQRMHEPRPVALPRHPRFRMVRWVGGGN